MTFDSCDDRGEGGTTLGLRVEAGIKELVYVIVGMNFVSVKID